MSSLSGVSAMETPTQTPHPEICSAACESLERTALANFDPPSGGGFHLFAIRFLLRFARRTFVKAQARARHVAVVRPKHALEQKVSRELQSVRDILAADIRALRAEEKLRQVEQSPFIWLAGARGHSAAASRRHEDEIVTRARGSALREIEAKAERVEQSRLPTDIERRPVFERFGKHRIEENLGRIEQAGMLLALGQRRT